MARSSRFQRDEGTPEINLSPMIDCIFILLIFFIVTTVFVEEVGLEVNKPQASNTTNLDEDKETVAIEITKSDKIMLDGKELELGTLAQRVKSATTRDKEIPVTITVHKNASHGLFSKVWAQAHANGAVNLSYTTTQ